MMLENGSGADPFSAAPFNPRSKGRRRDQKLAGELMVQSSYRQQCKCEICYSLSLKSLL